MSFDQRSAVSGKILASIPNEFRCLSKKLIEVTNVQSLSSAAPSPPVVIPQSLPMLSITAEPESPRAENEPDLEFLENTHTSFDILPGWPLVEYVLTKARMVLSRPMVRSDAFPFFMTMILPWSKLVVGLNISSEIRPRNEDGSRSSRTKTGEGPSTPLARQLQWRQD